MSSRCYQVDLSRALCARIREKGSRWVPRCRTKLSWGRLSESQGIGRGAKAELPFAENGFPTDEEAQQAGYGSTAEWYEKPIAPSIRGTPAAQVEIQQAQQQNSWGLKEEQGGERAHGVRVVKSFEDNERIPEQALACRPYLMVDVTCSLGCGASPAQGEQTEKKREDDSCNRVRDRLSEIAKADWSKDFGAPQRKLEWPAQIDGVNVRGAFSRAQKEDPDILTIWAQLATALADPKKSPELKGGQPLSSKELKDYRLNPFDDVVERKKWRWSMRSIGYP